MTSRRNYRELKEFSERFPFGARVIGLTGGIASGKTVATEALRANGYAVIDADEISRALSAVGTPLERLLADSFPECKVNGSLDRKSLRKLIAASPAAAQKLNSLTHPAIADEIKRRVAETPPPVVLSAPLLFECALASLCDCVVTVTCPRQIRIERIKKRDGVTASDAASIIDAQLNDALRVSLSDFCVPSDIPRDEFVNEITDLFDRLCARKR